MYHNPIVVHTDLTIEFLNPLEIIYIKSENQCTVIYMTEDREIKIISSLATLTPSLVAMGFFCCHKSHIVNLDKIVRYIRKGQLVMDNNSIIPISRRKRKALLNTLRQNFG